MINISGKISEFRTHLMGVAMIFIMLFHQYWISFPPFSAFHIWGHYGVDIFLFVSGFGLAFSLEKNSIRVFYHNRIIRLLPLCIFCGVCKYTIYYIGRESLQGIRSCTLWTLMGLDLWFIQTIWVFYLLSPFLFYVVKRSPLLLCVIIYAVCLLTSLLIPEVKNNITVSISRLPVFILGMIFAVKRISINRSTFFVSFIMLVIAMASTITTTKDVFHFGKDLWIFPILALGIPALISLLLFFVERLCIGKNILRYIGTHSLELYLWHEFVFACLCVTFNKHINSVVVFFIAFFTIFFLANFSSICVDFLNLHFLRKNAENKS